MKYIAGIDLGQSSVKPTTGICIMDMDKNVLYTSTTNSLNEIIKIIKEFECASAYIDAPLKLQFDNVEGVYLNRKAESLLIKRKNKFSINKRFSPMPVNMLSTLGQRAITLKNRLVNETPVKRVYEVHPRTTSEYLGIEHHKNDFKKFAYKLNSVSGIDIRDNSCEHVVDAVICAFTGYLREAGKCIFVGDEEEGMIIVPAPSDIKCVFFDMDGTLTEVKSPWQKVFEDFGLWKDKGEIFLQDFLDNKFGYEEFCVRDIKCWMDAGLTKQKIENSLNEIGINELAVQVIKELAGSGVKCIIISTGFYSTAERISGLCGLKFEKGLADLSANTLSVFANEIVEKNNLLKPVLDVYSETGHKKSKGAIVKKCLAKLKTGPIRSLSIGDSLSSDLELFEITGDFVYVNHARDILKLLEKININYD